MSSRQKYDRQPRSSVQGRPDLDEMGILADHFFQLVAMDPDDREEWQQLQADGTRQMEGPVNERPSDLGQQRADLLKGNQAMTDVQKKDAPGER